MAYMKEQGLHRTTLGPRIGQRDTCVDAERRADTLAPESRRAARQSTGRNMRDQSNMLRAALKCRPRSPPSQFRLLR
jgi:hypothetical protein